MLQADPPDVVRALVVAGDVQIPYAAIGRGPAVVLLTDAPLVRAAFLRGAPRRLRLLVPDGPHPCRPVDATAMDAAAAPGDRSGPRTPLAWLDRFLDALGIACVWIVTDRTYQRDAKAFALASPERVLGIGDVNALAADASPAWDELTATLAQIARDDGIDSKPGS